MSISVTGASDDLIEVWLDGDVVEEFTALDDAGDATAVLGFSNGVLIRVRFDDDGIWRIFPLKGSDKVTIVQADTDGYPDTDATDTATVESADWVVIGKEYAAPMNP